MRLFPDETTASFVRRLEHANALATGQLTRTLHKSSRPWADTLSAWTESDPSRLRLAMPQLAQQESLTIFDRRLLGRPNRRISRLACRLCAHERGAVDRIEIYSTHESVVCPRHGLWLGEGVETPRNQMSVRTCPGVLAAANHHRNLITRFGRVRVCTAFQISAYINRRWHDQGHHFDDFTGLHKNLIVTSGPDPTANYAIIAGALYPANARLTAILASPFWTTITHSTRPDTFLNRVANEVTNGWFPEGGADPLRRWMAENWSPSFAGPDTISLPLTSTRIEAAPTISTKNASRTLAPRKTIPILDLPQLK